MPTRLLSWILGLALFHARASSAEVGVQARFEKSLKEAKALSRVELVWLDSLWINDPVALKALDSTTAFSRTFQYSFIASGAKFRATCKLISGTKTNLVKLKEAAFDGKSYVTYTGDFGTMSKRSFPRPISNSESHNNPLVAPFMFLAKASESDPREMLRFTDIAAQEFGKGLTLPSGQSLAGSLEFSMPGLSAGNTATTWKVVVDESGDAFTPNTITEVFPGSGRQVAMRLLNYTNLGGYQFPSRIEWTASSFPPTSPPTLLSTGLVTLVSSRIPDRLPDSVFALASEEQTARTVWDWDRERLTKSGPPAEACLEARRLKDAGKQQADTNAPESKKEVEKTKP